MRLRLRTESASTCQALNGTVILLLPLLNSSSYGCPSTYPCLLAQRYCWATIGHLVHPLKFQRPHGFGDLHQNSLKPHTSRVGMVARRMQDIFVKGPHVQRNRDRIEIEDSCVRQDEAFWYDSDEIGLRDHVEARTRHDR